MLKEKRGGNRLFPLLVNFDLPGKMGLGALDISIFLRIYHHKSMCKRNLFILTAIWYEFIEAENVFTEKLIMGVLKNTDQTMKG